MTSNAILFAGQGAQFVGMGKDLADAVPACRALFDRANAVLGFDLAKLCFEGPIETLTRSDNCQPAIFVVSLACYTAFRQRLPDCAPTGAAGLSLGEWTALHAAGVISFDDTLKILRARGQYMQTACDEQPGGMLSVMGLPMPELEKICAAANVQIANLNSPEQTVLSGHKAGIIEAETLAKAAGAKRTFVLNVAGAFHSRLMASAATRLSTLLASIPFAAPRFPVMSNATGRPHGTPDEIRARMVDQVTESVQWVADIQGFQTLGVRTYIECGPGKILGGLVKRIDNDAAIYSIQDQATLDKAVCAISQEA
ncbi:MAG: ACP S-malonyltransferase [bacterium]